MNMLTLRQNLRTLLSLPEAEAPMLSCYVDLADAAHTSTIGDRVHLVRRGLGLTRRVAFDQAVGCINEALVGAKEGTRSLAVFARGGAAPFSLTMELKVPVDTQLIVDHSPHIFQLVRLKDDYDRYLVLFLTDSATRLVEITLGAVTRELWQAQPALRRRVGHDWARVAYRLDGTPKQRATLDALNELLRTQARAGGSAHLVLAGSPTLAMLFRRQLPPDLAALVVDVVAVAQDASTDDIVRMTLASYLEHEEAESLGVVAELWRELAQDGLAVSGVAEVLRALDDGLADRVVLARPFVAPHGWACGACATAGLGLPPASCPSCAGQPRHADVREALIALAELHDVHVEVVQDSELLMQLGGVGALLRRRPGGPSGAVARVSLPAARDQRAANTSARA